MFTHNLPTYVIVELLIRLSQYNYLIGEYKNHSVFNAGVMVMTSGGSISFPANIITQQFEDPTSITESELAGIALLFRQG